MNETLYLWLNSGWQPILLFFVLWLGSGITATTFLHKHKLIPGALFAGVFAAGSAFAVQLQVVGVEKTSGIESLFSVLAGLFSLIVVFAFSYRKPAATGKEEQEQ